MATTNVSINVNATIENVTEVLGTSIVYTLLCGIFSYLCFMYVRASIMGDRKMYDKIEEPESKYEKSATQKLTQLVSVSASPFFGLTKWEIFVRFVFSVAFKWALFITAWTLYTGTVLYNTRFYSFASALNLVIPQDVFNYAFSAYCFGALTVFDILGCYRDYYGREKDESHSFNARLAFTSILFGGAVVLPAAYAFATADATTVSNTGLLVPMTFFNGLALASLIVFAGFYVFWWKERDQDLRNLVQETYILMLGPRDKFRGSVVGYIPGFYLPGSWIAAHLFFTLSYAFIIYQDGTKPIVFTAVVCVIPIILMLKSRQVWTYMAWHLSMAGFWIVVNVLTASMTGPLGGGAYAPQLTSFVDNVNVTHYNYTLNKLTRQSEFFLTGPTPESLTTIYPTAYFAWVATFVLVVICIFFNSMGFEPMTGLTRAFPAMEKATKD